MRNYLLPSLSSATASLDLQVVSLQGVRLLVVDDSLDCQGFFSMLFQSYDADAQIVGSANQALEVFTSFQPHVLITDIAMPFLDGLELLPLIRRLEVERCGLSIPAIAVTAIMNDKIYLDAKQAGYQAIFSKPVDIDALIATILNLK